MLRVYTCIYICMYADLYSVCYVICVSRDVGSDNLPLWDFCTVHVCLWYLLWLVLCEVLGWSVCLNVAGDTDTRETSHGGSGGIGSLVNTLLPDPRWKLLEIIRYHLHHHWRYTTHRLRRSGKDSGGPGKTTPSLLGWMNSRRWSRLRPYSQSSEKKRTKSTPPSRDGRTMVTTRR